MKFPNHTLLDISKSKLCYSNQYWVHKYLALAKHLQSNEITFENLNVQKYFFLKKEPLLLNKLIKNQKQFTLRYSLSNLSLFLNSSEKKFCKTIFSTKVKVKSRLRYSTYFGKEIYDFLNNPKQKFNEKLLKRQILNFKYNKTISSHVSDKLWNLFDVNFLRKEKIYTKLKYSRVPQYDIVSGGVAALFAGFLGFLICEKFGFELADSGDFYILFMYVVFLVFFLRLFVKLISTEANSWNPLSFKWLFYFYQTLLILIFNFFKNFIK